MTLAMCQYEKCPKKLECFRYMAEIDPDNTSYVFFKAICNEKNNFEWFATITAGDKIRKVEIDEQNNDTL